MSITMYDSISSNVIPANPQAVAGYVGGYWPNYNTLVRQFPKADHLSIAVSAFENAECLDVEGGDATPWQTPAWVKRQQTRGVSRPVLYASISEMPSILSALSAEGIHRSEVRLWSAHYTYRPHICSSSCGFGFTGTADGTQWTKYALNRNLDQSMLEDNFFNTKPKPVVNELHYELFATGPFPSRWGKLNERVVVEQYDGARRHPIAYALYLKFVVRPKLQFLADRVAFVAIHDQVNEKPSWSKFNRGWRFQQLIHRAQGQRFI